MKEKRVLYLQSSFNADIVRTLNKITERPEIMTSLGLNKTLRLVHAMEFYEQIEIPEEIDLIICTNVQQCKKLKEVTDKPLILYTNDPREPIESAGDIIHHRQGANPFEFYREISNIIEQYLNLQG